MPTEKGKAMSEELKLYTKTHGDQAKEYQYGPSWKAAELLVDGGYPTPEEAIEAWYRENAVLPVRCRDCELFSYNGRLPLTGCCSVIPARHSGDQYCSYGVKKRTK